MDLSAYRNKLGGMYAVWVPENLSGSRGSIRSQARLCMHRLKSLLEDADTSIDNTVKVLAFVIDLKDRAVFNEVYREYFHAEPPARSCVAVSDMGEGVLLELECIACIPD